MSDLRDAIRQFPVVLWLSQHCRVYDSGAENVYIDCPVCRGRAKLGVHRTKKLAQCFKCAEGGAGAGVWNGKSDLVGLVRLIEGCRYSTAFSRIFAMSGIPETEYRRRVVDSKEMPKESLPLSETSPKHPSRAMMISRGVDHLSADSRVCVDGRYAGRVILPCRWFGESDGWEAKSYDKNLKPKSRFPDWFQASQSVYSTKNWDHGSDFAVITESIFDAETFGLNACGIYGSTLREGQLVKLLSLRDLGVRRLIWCLDYDAWSKQCKAILGSTLSGFDNFVIRLPQWTDPNQLGRDACWDAVASAVHVRDSLDLALLDVRN